MKVLHLFPVLSVTKVTNPLSRRARKSLDVDWNHYYDLKIGFLFWEKQFTF